MTIGDAYIQFLILVNRNATNNQVNVDLPRFVKLFNNIQNKFVEWILEKRNEDDIRDIQRILVIETALAEISSEDSHNKFALPSDYFNFANITALASTECCKNERMLVWEVKSEDVEEKLNDKHNEPSFEARETFFYFTSNAVAVYKKNFDISGVLLSYYRYPRQVDIAGYVDRLTQQPSANIDPEFDDKVVNRILLAMAKEFTGINENAQGYNLAKDRLFTI